MLLLLVFLLIASSFSFKFCQKFKIPNHSPLATSHHKDYFHFWNLLVVLLPFQHPLDTSPWQVNGPFYVRIIKNSSQKFGSLLLMWGLCYLCKYSSLKTCFLWVFSQFCLSYVSYADHLEVLIRVCVYNTQLPIKKTIRTLLQ